MENSFKAAEFLFKKMKNLYSTFEYPDEFDVELWEEILEGHSQTQILDALKAYRKEVVYNKAPTPAEFNKFLTSVNSDDLRQQILSNADRIGNRFGKEARERFLNSCRQHWTGVDLSNHFWEEPSIPECEANLVTDLATEFMQRDVKSGRNRHILPVYQKAVRYIAEDVLSQEMPVSEWRKLDFQQRQETALKRGLFANFSDVLVLICRKYYGKDYQFDSADMVNSTGVYSAERAVQSLASHYRTDEAEFAKTANF